MCDGDQRRRAGGLDGDARAPQVELVGDPGRQEVLVVAEAVWNSPTRADQVRRWAAGCGAGRCSRRRPRRRRSPCPSTPGALAACSSASQAHSRNSRCCGSIISASRRREAEEGRRRSRSMSSSDAAAGDVGRAGRQLVRGDAGGEQFLVGEGGDATRRRRAGSARRRPGCPRREHRRAIPTTATAPAGAPSSSGMSFVIAVSKMSEVTARSSAVPVRANAPCVRPPGGVRVAGREGEQDLN